MPHHAQVPAPIGFDAVLKLDFSWYEMVPDGTNFKKGGAFPLAVHSLAPWAIRHEPRERRQVQAGIGHHLTEVKQQLHSALQPRAHDVLRGSPNNH
jgi:hypothetical protein